MSGVRLSMVKTATDERSERELAAEAAWLRELEKHEALEGQVPRLLDEGRDAEGRPYLVVSVVRDAGETRSFTPGHARFLASLGKARFRATDFEVSGCGQWLQHSLRELEGIAAPRALERLGDAYAECETKLLYWTGPYVLSQGDFAPWNIRLFGSGLFVFDWGRARAEASPLDDVLHYLMIQRALCRRPVGVRFLRAAMRRAHDFAAGAYPEWAWRPQVIGALTLVYLLGVVLHQSLATRRIDPADPVVSAYWKLIEKRPAWMPE